MLKLLTPSKPREVQVDVSTEYLDLCTDLGIRTLTTTHNALLVAAKKAKLPVYDNQQVDRYMRSITPRGLAYFWSHLAGPQEPNLHSKASIEKDGLFCFDKYERPVPIHILRRVKLMRDMVPKATFYVTDYAVRDPDPFVCARIERGEHVVFGVWDEPGFRGTAEI